jgi:uncharacterized membrane protein YgaE (UPF0421/DUF939 family)
MKFKIGYRTLKTAIGTALSIIIAQAVGLDNSVSAGILTILCVQVTKMKSLEASWHRFLACILAMVFAVAFFEGIGYHPLVIGLLLLFFIPTVVMFKAREGVVSSSVILLHIYSAGQISVSLLVSEFEIIIIGIGVALLMNLYMPSVERKLDEYQQKVEEKFKIIFHEIVVYLRTNVSVWDGKEITEVAGLLEEAKILASRDVENRLLNQENRYYQYFKIREKQFEIIERVLPTVTSIQTMVRQREMVAEFIEELAKGINPGNRVYLYLEKLMKMRKDFEKMELPKTREEFVARAALLHFTNEMERYLIIKSSFKGLYNKQKVYQKGEIETN